jgi:hypothetical protein
VPPAVHPFIWNCAFPFALKPFVSAWRLKSRLGMAVIRLEDFRVWPNIVTETIDPP